MLRLQRVGKIKQPSYRLIVSPKTRDTQGRSVEMLGEFHPLMNPPLVNFKKERIQYWLSVGAQCSATVHNLLVSNGVIEGKKQKVVRLSATRKAALAAKEKAKASEAVAPVA